MLCRLLDATGKSGHPDSHFHSPSISAWMGYYDVELDSAKSECDLLADIFTAARNRGTGNTGMFGLRLQRHSFDFFIQKLQVLVSGCSSDHERIEKAFGQTLFIHLTRKNKLEQAISYVKASQTGVWHKAPDGTELERLSVLQEPFYDFEAIQRHLTELDGMDKNWIFWFSKERLTPLRIYYEELSKDPIAITGQLLEKLGLNNELTRELEVPVAKLADCTNREWAMLFCKHRLMEKVPDNEEPR